MFLKQNLGQGSQIVNFLAQSPSHCTKEDQGNGEKFSGGFNINVLSSIVYNVRFRNKIEANNTGRVVKVLGGAVEVPSRKTTKPCPRLTGGPTVGPYNFLDVSYCMKMGPQALEAFGRSFRLLVWLRRRMYSPAVSDKEAHAIASTMPNLRHLETAYLLLSTDGVVKILSNCW